jgi:hypothetical protein
MAVTVHRIDLLCRDIENSPHIYECIVQQRVESDAAMRMHFEDE